MSTHPNLDRQALQTLLASAFSVQESGISKQSLSALIEVQKSIAKHESLERILALITDRARMVAGATGVAIGLLTGNRLVYRGGSGSAAGCIGQHLTAVLSLSGHGGERKEILRVENAETDARIEAAICREREAKALLMIPIYQERIVAGVLEILFSDPHTFDDREIRTYRLIAGLVEEAMLGDIQQAEPAPPATQLPSRPARDSVEILTPPVTQVCEPVPAAVPVLSRLYPPNKNEKTIRWQAKSSLFHDPRWAVDAALIVMILGMGAWISIHSHASTRFEALPKLNASSPIPKPNATILQENHNSKPQKALVKTESASGTRSAFRRVPVGPTEVDYIAEDVTIRRFTTKTAGAHARAANQQFDIGDDVTVRVFTDSSAASSTQAP